MIFGRYLERLGGFNSVTYVCVGDVWAGFVWAIIGSRLKVEYVGGNYGWRRENEGV